MKRSFLFAAALLWFGTPFVVAQVEADCAENVYRLTLELTSLESESDASDEQVAAEQARLGPKAAVLGDYEYPNKSGQDIYFDVHEGEPLGNQHLQQGQVP